MSHEPGQRDSRGVAAVTAALLVSVAGSVGLLIAYWGDAGVQAEGVGLAVAFGGLAVAAGVWGRRAVPARVAIEHWSPPGSGDDVAEQAVEELELTDDESLTGPDQLRRRGLIALLGVAGGALVAGLASPFRSLGPSPLTSLEKTGWTAGRRLVDSEGGPLEAAGLVIDNFVTAFPEGDDFRADSQVLLVRMKPEDLQLDEEAKSLTADGIVAYSKVCTHAGCPVGLYDSNTKELFCPCHQSVFRADKGAVPTFGPAARPLPQLPIAIDSEGYLIALGDFPEPIGPSFWSRS